jgi:hypothetical protein
MSTELLILLVAILVAVVIVVWRYLQYRDMQTWHRSEYSSLRTQLRERQEQEIEASASEPPSLVRKTIIVNTRDGRTIRGVLMSEHDDRITLSRSLLHGWQWRASTGRTDARAQGEHLVPPGSRPDPAVV